MNGPQTIRLLLEQGQGWILSLFDDMKDAPTQAPTPNGGNHPLWNLGHLAYSESNLLHAFIKGEANPLDDWKELFANGTEPVADASKYPSFDEVLAKLKAVRAESLKMLEGLSDQDLDRPSHAPEEMKGFFGTIGQCFVAMGLHSTFHGGQVADARRAAGRKPLMG